MSTRSTIALERLNGTVAAIYCHFDGYLSNNGRLLMEHWHHPALAAQLIQLGDLSILGKVIGEKHDFDYKSKLYDECRKPSGGTDHDKMALLEAKMPWVTEEWCRAYHRDRGEPWKKTKDHGGTAPAILDSVEKLIEFHEHDYLYLFRDGTWWLWDEHQFGAYTTDEDGDLTPVWETRIPGFWRTLMSALTSDPEIDTPIRPGPRPYLRSRYRDGHLANPEPVLHEEGRRAVLI